jgi:hypothetical protein
MSPPINWQTELARGGGVGLLKRLEELGHLCRSHADAVVADFKSNQ